MGFWHCDSVWSVLLLDASFVPVSYDSIKKPGRTTKSRPLRTSIFNNKCTLLNCYSTLSSFALNLMLHTWLICLEKHMICICIQICWVFSKTFYNIWERTLIQQIWLFKSELNWKNLTLCMISSQQWGYEEDMQYINCSRSQKLQRSMHLDKHVYKNLDALIKMQIQCY